MGYLGEYIQVLDQVLVWLVAVPLALPGCPPEVGELFLLLKQKEAFFYFVPDNHSTLWPGLPVLHPVLRAVVHCKHILLPLRLPRLRRWKLNKNALLLVSLVTTFLQLGEHFSIRWRQLCLTCAANLTLLKLPKSSLTALYEIEWGLPRCANGSYSIVTRRYLTILSWGAWDHKSY